MFDDRDLLPGEYAVLGLLTEEPAHGYELARRWRESALHAVHPVEQNLVYAYLKNLERRGLVDWIEARAGNRPPRKIYEPTEDGVLALGSWMRAPVERLREVRLDWLLKLYFLRRLDPRAEPRLIERQVEALDRYLDRARDRLSDEPDEFTRLVLDSRINAAEATLRWISTLQPDGGGRQRRAS